MKIMQKIAPAFVAGAAILWGILIVFVRQLDSAGLDSMEIVTLRVYGSALLLLVGLSVYNRSLLKIRCKDIWCFMGTGIISIVFFSYCYYRNVTVSSAAVSSILLYTSPVWVTILSRFAFKERIGKKKLAALCMAAVFSRSCSCAWARYSSAWAFACFWYSSAWAWYSSVLALAWAI